jgi:two-component system response regulator WspF
MKIGIVNDTPMAVEALLRTLALKPEYEVIWAAVNGAEAVKACAKATPDLVLMDLVMPVMDGVEATRQIMAKTPCPILIVTASVGGNQAQVFEAMGHGALDAVKTPPLGVGDPRVAAAPFFAKIDVLATLTRDKSVKADGKAARPGAKPQRRNGERLVALGASAGGPTALGIVLRALPKDFEAAVVVVQHVDQHFASGMAEWLSQHSVLPVRVAKEGDRPERGLVLLAGTGDHLKLKKPDRLGYSPEPRDHAYKPSVDVFFESVGELWPGEAVGVLLTGMGRDGAQGLKALRDKGHHTITQDRATSAVYGMPKAAASLDAAVDILPVNRIAPRLVEVVRGG